MSRALSPRSAVTLVARREIASRATSRAFLVSNLVVLAAIAIGIVVIAVVTGGDSGSKVGLVGGAQQLEPRLTATAEVFGVDLDTSDVDSAQAARDKVRDEDLDVALIAKPDGGYIAVTRESLAEDVEAVVRTAVNDVALTQALAAQGVDRADLDEALQGRGVTIEALDPPDPEETQRTALAYIAVLILFFQIFIFGLYVATGVVEEKASRVVELLLSTIRPIDLLVGKILGIGAVGLGQLVAYGVVGLGAALATDLVTVTGTAVAVFAVAIAWFVLGFVFFGVLYAAAGSMVSRQEDVNATTTPINFLAFAVFFLAQYSLSDPDGTIASVLAWVPPFSAALMPLRVASGDATLVQVFGSAALMIAATAVLAVLAARIYERSILRSGTATTWREVLRMPARTRS